MGTGSKAYALKFISGKYQGGEFPLKTEKQIVIGRSSELDMVLVEDMVSRKHAKITVQPGRITIEDLGSTNGTFVNGQRVDELELKEGDRILIGTSILKLVLQAELLDMVQLVLEQGTVGGVLDRAVGSDIDTAQLLKQLIDRDVVRAV